MHHDMRVCTFAQTCVCMCVRTNGVLSFSVAHAEKRLGSSTPFNAKNIAELRAKVLAGRYKPITPGRYSETFISVVHGLLQLNPAKRTDMAKLLALPKMAAMNQGRKGKPTVQENPSGSDLLKTIKVMTCGVPLESDRSFLPLKAAFPVYDTCSHPVAS